MADFFVVLKCINNQIENKLSNIMQSVATCTLLIDVCWLTWNGMATPACEKIETYCNNKLSSHICNNLIHKSSLWFPSLIINNFNLALFSAWVLVHLILPLQLYISSWLHHGSLDKEPFWYSRLLTHCNLT